PRGPVVIGVITGGLGCQPSSDHLDLKLVAFHTLSGCCEPFLNIVSAYAARADLCAPHIAPYPPGWFSQPRSIDIGEPFSPSACFAACDRPSRSTDDLRIRLRLCHSA